MTTSEISDVPRLRRNDSRPSLIDRIDAALGHPRRDPHGDPIPQPSGDYAEDWPPALDGAPAGVYFRVDRVSDEDSAALEYLAGLSVRPGVTLRVLEREPFGGPLWVEAGGQRHAMGIPLARLVHGIVPS
jgi:DtxR family Mn-dependent transcriptional regulator